MQESKWNFLIPFVQAHRVLNPNMPIKEIANLAVQKYALALDVEQVRKIISRLLQVEIEKRIEDKLPYLDQSLIQSPKEIKTEPRKATTVTHFKHKKAGTYIVLGCWHVPFDNKKLTNNVVRLIEDINPQGIILNGDFLDCNSLSGHDRGKFTAIKGLNLDNEYEAGQEAIYALTSTMSKDALKVYMYGNHEDRYFRFISDMQNAKTPPPSPTKGLKLKDQGFTVIESYQSGYMTLGEHLDILHGVYYNTHCAKTHIDKFRGSTLFAHTHRIQSYIEGHTGGFNIGWGGDVNSAAFNYADRGTKAGWQNGFAVVHIDEEGWYYVQQIIANNGGFYYGSKHYNYEG